MRKLYEQRYLYKIFFRVLFFRSIFLNELYNIKRKIDKKNISHCKLENSIGSIL